MRAEAYFITGCPNGQLAIMPRPRAGDWLEDEIASWQQQGINVVVSLLESEEIRELGLEEEQRFCEKLNLEFIQFPIPDRDIPASEEEVSNLVSQLVEHLRAGRGVGIHCRIGVGRSATLAVCVLAALSVPLDQAWSQVEQSRGLSVPDTEEQREWVASWLTR